MKALFISTALLVASAALSAQEIQPETAKPPASATTQDPEVVREPTPEERVAQLKAEVEKLQNELKALEQVEKSGGITEQVKATLGTRRVVTQSFADPNPQPQPAAQPEPVAQPDKKPARLLGDAEKAGLAPDVVFLVDGQPVTKGEFDGAVAYLESYLQDQSPEQIRTQAVLELVRVKAARAAFPESGGQAKARILEIQQELKSGDADFAEVAKQKSDCPSKTRGGDLGEFGRVGMDFWFTRGAFDLDVGEVSGVVESTFGYHLIKVTEKKAGDTPNQDRVQASHILALFTPNQVELAQVSRRVNSGQADLAFVSDEYRVYTPPAFK